MSLRAPRLLLAALVAVFAMLPASTVRAAAERGPRAFLEVGEMALGVEGGFTTGGVRVCSVAPLRPGVDWSLTLGLVPAILGTTDFDFSLPVPLGTGVSLIPRAGATAFFVAGGDIGGAALGWNYGIGLVLNPHGPVALRGDMGVHALGTAGFESDSVIRTASVGISW